MLRINSNHLLRRYNKRSLLRWIISAWELYKDFIKWQEEGMIPLTEDFDQIRIFQQGTTLEEVHPHWISLSGRLHLQKLYKDSRVLHPVSCGFVFVDERENYRGIEWIDVGERQVVSVESAMRNQHFPVDLGELFREILFILLYDKLIEYLETGKGAVLSRFVEKRIKYHQRQYENAGCHFGGGTSVNVSLKWGPRADV